MRLLCENRHKCLLLLRPKTVKPSAKELKTGKWDSHLFGNENPTLSVFCQSENHEPLTETPKSGDVELQIAPRLAVASIASTAKRQFGI